MLRPPASRGPESWSGPSCSGAFRSGVQSHEGFSGYAGDASVPCSVDEARPSLDGDGSSPLDVTTSSTGVLRIAACAPEFGCSAESFDQIVDGSHRPLLRKMRSDVNARCVTQFAKSVGMTDVHERLAWARRHHGLHHTPTDAARAYGWPVSTYLGHENGDRKPSRDAAKKYAEVYGVRWEWLLENEGQPIAANVVKVVGRIGAGGAIDPDFEQVPPEGLFEITVPVDIPKDAVAFEVSGDSMFPRYDDGDVVICWRQGINPREVIGWEAAVQTVEGKRYLKRIVEGSTPKTFDLESYNALPIRSVKLDWVSRVDLVVRRGQWERIKKRTIAAKLRGGR